MPTLTKTQPKIKKTEKRKDGHWIFLTTPDGLIEMGPYDTREEMDSDANGVINYYLHQHEAGYVTSEKPVIKPKTIPYVPPAPIKLEDLGESIMEE